MSDQDPQGNRTVIPESHRNAPPCPPPFRPPPYPHGAGVPPPPFIPQYTFHRPPYPVARPPLWARGEYYTNAPVWATPQGPYARPPHQPPRLEPRPVASIPIPGTEWLEVTTDTGTRFWHNTSSGKGTWKMPSEIKAVGRAPPPLNAAKLKMLERAKASGAVIAPAYAALAGKAPLALTYDDVDVTFTEDEISAPRSSTKKRSASEMGAPQTGDDSPAIALRDDPETAFKALLQELGVHAFSRFEKEIKKLEKEQRFLALPSERRRAVFEEYCSQLGQFKAKTSELKVPEKETLGHRKPKAAKLTGSSEEQTFTALLQERVSNTHTSFARLAEDFGEDERFLGVRDPDRRESLFAQHLEALRRAQEARDRAERRGDRELHLATERQRQAGVADANANFRTLLAEAVHDVESSWAVAWPRLQRDAQGRATNPLLDLRTAEKLYEEHLEGLKARAVEEAV